MALRCECVSFFEEPRPSSEESLSKAFCLHGWSGMVIVPSIGITTDLVRVVGHMTVWDSLLAHFRPRLVLGNV